MINVYKTYDTFTSETQVVSNDFADGYDSGEPTRPVDLGVITYPLNKVPVQAGPHGGPSPLAVWFKNMYFTPRYRYSEMVLEIEDIVANDPANDIIDTSGEEVSWIKLALDSKINYPKSQNDVSNSTGFPTFGSGGASISITNTSNANSTILEPDDYFIVWVHIQVVGEPIQTGTKYFRFALNASRVAI